MVDLRSDTVTQPTDEMRRAIASAVVGDDVFGEDSTVAELERASAEFLGKEAAVFVPSGTMANQVAIHVHCRPGDELICEERCHTYEWEGGGAAQFSGVQIRPLSATDGFPTAGQIAAAVRPVDDHFPRSRLLILENTHNMAGGRVLDVAGTVDRVQAARRAGMLAHLDGARVVNAAVACGASAADLAAPFNSASLCLSKGLGAPVGSVLAGDADFIVAARHARKSFGGGMRQAGVLAAAALLALRDGPAELARDHQRAATLAEGLAALEGLSVQTPETNIVMVETAASAPTFVEFLEERGVRVLSYGAHRVRFVTHRDLRDGDVERCIEAARAWSEQSTKQSRGKQQ